MSFLKQENLTNKALQAVVWLNSLTVLFVISIYGYQGRFSRPLADDYCVSDWLASTPNLWDATLLAYTSWLNSYSIIFFAWLIDGGGIAGYQFMAGFTILLWVGSVAFLISEIGKSMSFSIPPLISLWLAALGIFVSFYQTPVLYQILYWRSGLIPYTLPLAFFVAVAAWILHYARQPYRRAYEMRIRVATALVIFFVSGLGETTSALLVGLLFLAVGVIWLTLRQRQRKDILTVLGIALFTAVVALLIVTFSPGTASRLETVVDTPIYNPFVLGGHVVLYTAQFLWDNLKVTPLTMLIAIVIPFGVMYVHSLNPENQVRFTNKQLLFAIVVLLALMFIAIGFSFAPSAFVSTYPVARARFASHFVMNQTLIFIGGILGVFASRIKPPVNSSFVTSAILILLGVMSLYPLYTTPKISAALAENQIFAAAWDERDAFIRSEIANGVTNLVVVQLDSIGGVGEYKDNPDHWINRCAARFYGVNSIIALLP